MVQKWQRWTATTWKSYVVLVQQGMGIIYKPFSRVPLDLSLGVILLKCSLHGSITRLFTSRCPLFSWLLFPPFCLAFFCLPSFFHSFILFYSFRSCLLLLFVCLFVCFCLFVCLFWGASLFFLLFFLRLFLLISTLTLFLTYSLTSYISISQPVNRSLPLCYPSLSRLG